MNSDPRPVFLNLLQIRLPVPGVLSIAHRLSGVVLFLAIPLVIGLLERVLSGQHGYAQVAELLSASPARLVLFLLLWALSHHFLAGIRYLLIDVDLGVVAPAFRLSAWAVLLAAPLLAGLLLWGLA